MMETPPTLDSSPKRHKKPKTQSLSIQDLSGELQVGHGMGAVMENLAIWGNGNKAEGDINWADLVLNQ